MKNYLFKLHTLMFDGDGGDGGTAAASTSADSGAPAPEADPVVVYGKGEADEAGGQVGTDTDGEGQPQEESPDPEAAFEELIKGEYKDQFDSRVQSIIQQRFKNSEDYQGRIASYDEATAPLYAIYGVKPGDVDGLKAAIENDGSLYAAKADEAGITEQQYRENLRLRMEAAQGRSIREQMEAEQQRQAMFTRWDQEGAQLKTQFPEFDLVKEIESNEAFAKKLNAGYSVKDAFYTCHMSEILDGTIKQSETAATQQFVSNFNSRQARPPENAATQTPAVVRKTDPSKWTDEDFDEVEKKVMAGEKVIL